MAYLFYFIIGYLIVIIANKLRLNCSDLVTIYIPRKNIYIKPRQCALFYTRKFCVKKINEYFKLRSTFTGGIKLFETVIINYFNNLFYPAGGAVEWIKCSTAFQSYQLHIMLIMRGKMLHILSLEMSGMLTMYSMFAAGGKTFARTLLW